MTHATDKQIALIDSLAAKRGQSTIAAIEEFGLGLKPARDLTKIDASQVIDWLMGRPIDAGVDRTSDAYKAGVAKAEDRDAEFRRRFPGLS